MRVQRIHKIISSKIAIHENLDPRKFCTVRYSYIYIPPWSVVILHIGVADTNMQDHPPREAYNCYIPCYLGNITVAEHHCYM